MKTPSFIKNAFYSWAVFFGTVILLSVGYAAWNTTMGPVTSGNSLTATWWNALVDNITDLNDRVSGVTSSLSALQVSAGNLWAANGGNISYTGGNVGIGTTTPGALVHVYKESGNNAEIDIQSTAGTDKHWAIYNDRTSSSLRFWNNNGGTEKNILTLGSTGNIGIGTTSPAMGLEINRNNGYGFSAWFRSSATASGVGLGTVSSVGAIQGSTSTGASSTLVINPYGGNVGIGWSTPSARLSIDGAVHMTWRVGTETTLTGVVLPMQGTYIGWNEDEGRGMTNFMNHRGTGGGGFNFSVFDNNGGILSIPMTIYGNGIVGIGTTSPVTKLSVTSDTTTKTPYDVNELFQFHGGTATYGTVSNDTTTLGIGTYDSGNDGMFTSSAEGGFVGTLNSAPLNFRVTNAERMRIDTNGNIGIGTISPQSRLSVQGPFTGLTSGNTQEFMRVGDSRGGVAGDSIRIVGIRDTTAANVGEWTTQRYRLGRNVDSVYDSAAIDFIGDGSMGLLANSAERVRISSSGNVGIGTTTPAQKLSVAGTIESTSGGYKFPDGTVQTSAASGGGLWYGQTWQDVASSRALGTTYTNSTGKPIMVIGSCTSVSGTPWIQFYINGVLAQSSVVSATWWSGAFGGAVIPNGSTYQVVGSPSANLSIKTWLELR